MLSQLVTGRRVKIGDPAVLARLSLLERRIGAAPPARPDELLARVRRSRPRLTSPELPREPGAALRAVAEPAQLAAAASVLGPRFPALAELLRRAALGRV
jgi:hypothetical protein